MYGKLDEKMNRDDGVPLADQAWRMVEAEKELRRAIDVFIGLAMQTTVEDALMARLSRIAEECRNAGV